MTNPYGQPGQDPQQAGGYPQSGGFQQPGYPQSGGFQQPGTPPGGYAQPAYPSAPSYPSSVGQNQLTNARPGSATAAAVLGFVQAGITLITTILMLFGLANVSSAASDSGELALAWIVTLAQALGAGLLIYGGVQLIGGTGRTIFIAAAGVELAICVYYLIRILSLDTSGELPGATQLKSSAAMIPILFAVMPIIGLSLAMTGSASAWAQSKRAR